MGVQATKDSPLGMTLEPFKVGISMLAADLHRNKRCARVPIERRISSAAAALSSAALHCRGGHVGLWVALRIRTERQSQAGTERRLARTPRCRRTPSHAGHVVASQHQDRGRKGAGD